MSDGRTYSHSSVVQQSGINYRQARAEAQAMSDADGRTRYVINHGSTTDGVREYLVETAGPSDPGAWPAPCYAGIPVRPNSRRHGMSDRCTVHGYCTGDRAECDGALGHAYSDSTWHRSRPIRTTRKVLGRGERIDHANGLVILRGGRVVTLVGAFPGPEGTIVEYVTD